MNEKFYYKKWFVILWLVMLTPVGLFLLWKSPNFTVKGKKIAAVVSTIWFIIVLLMPGDPTAESSYDVKSSSITYTTKDIPGKPAVYKDATTYSTAMSGEYVIGTAPKDLVTGKEEEFTTAQSGVYTAGTDFEPGVYDIEVVSGNGNVQGTGLNEIMGTEDKNSVVDMYVPEYDNKVFAKGDTFTVTGVSLDLKPNEDKVLVKEATDPIPGHEQTETLESSPKGDICSVDGTETDCSQVAKYKKLKSSLTVSSTVTESVTLSNDEYVCKSDANEVDCKDLVNYDNLVKELKAE